MQDEGMLQREVEFIQFPEKKREFFELRQKKGKLDLYSILRDDQKLDQFSHPVFCFLFSMSYSFFGILCFSYIQNQARIASQTGMVAEKKRIEALQESRGISKQRKSKLRDANGFAMSKKHICWKADKQHYSIAKVQEMGKGACPVYFGRYVILLMFYYSSPPGEINLRQNLSWIYLQFPNGETTSMDIFGGCYVARKCWSPFLHIIILFFISYEHPGTCQKFSVAS